MTRVPDLAELEASYELDLRPVVERLRAWPTPLKLVGLQFPDGFRDYAASFAKRFEAELGVPCVVSADPSYGACDVAVELVDLGADVVVHFAHTEMPSVTPGYHGVPVLYVPARHKAPVAAVVVKAAAELAAHVAAQAGGAAGERDAQPKLRGGTAGGGAAEERDAQPKLRGGTAGGGAAEERDAQPRLRVGLVTTAQHAHKLGEAVDALRAAGHEPVVGKGDDRVLLPGQLLGCNFTAGKAVEDLVDGYVYVGSGDFHPIAIQFGTTRKVVLADPYTGEVRVLDEVMDRLVRQRFAAIERAKGAERFAILVGTEAGQSRMRLALGLKRMLESKGKEATLVALGFFSPDNLQYFRHLDCFVNTGCPRITLDDAERGYPVPMITPPELEVVLGKRTWEDYAFDEFKGTKPAPRGAARVATREEL